MATLNHTRRSALLRGGCIMIGVALPGAFALASAQTAQLLKVASTDPDLPFIGNQQGDVTVVEYFDYRCPYCKRANAPLMRAIKEDGRARLLLRDWPILGDVSIHAAKLALAARYQDRFGQAHEALITALLPTAVAADQAVERAGINLARATRDGSDHAFEIDDILTRNADQARAFGFSGTPSFLVGSFHFFGALEEGDYLTIIRDARAGSSGTLGR